MLLGPYIKLVLGLKLSIIVAFLAIAVSSIVS